MISPVPITPVRPRLGLCAMASLALCGVTGPSHAQQGRPPEAANGSPADGGIGNSDAVAIEVLVVADAPHPVSAPRERHVSGSVLTGDRLKQPGAGAADVLREAPGVQVTQSGGLGAPATASLRGATAAQTPVYLGRVRINDEVGGAANLGDIPLFLIERVEIYRSHAPLTTDRMGVGGAIFFEPKRPQRTEMGVGALAGSFGARAAEGYAAAGDAGRGALAGVSLIAADNDYDFHDDRGTVYTGDDDRRSRLRNADNELLSFWLMAHERAGRVRFDLLMHHASREQGAVKLALTQSEQARIRLSRQLVALTSAIPVDAWRGDLRLTTAATQSTTTIDDPGSELGLLSSFTETPGEHLEQTLHASHELGMGLRVAEQLSISVERLRRLERRHASQREELAAKRWSLRPALAASLPVTNRLSINATAAFDCYDTRAGDLSVCSRQASSARAGIVYEAPTYEVYANTGRYYRLPTLSELFGAALLVRGNPALVPESGETVEIGARWQHPGRAGRPAFWIDAAGFARRSAELLTYVRTAQGYLHPVNRDTARHLGGELTVGTAPLYDLELSAGVSVVDARDTSPNRTTQNAILPFTSRVRFVALAGYSLNIRARFLERAGFSARYLYQASTFADPAGLGVIPPQDTLDLELMTLWLEHHLTARARAANVLDERRFDVVGFPLPGRSFFLSMEVTW